MADNIPFTQLDFDQIKQNLKAYLSAQDRFKDYNFEGSNISVLLDLMAYNTFQNNYYTNMAFSEMFLDSAQLRESAISHAKELNYLPQSRHSSQAKINLSINAFDNPVAVTVPRGTKFRAICGTKTFTFVTDTSYTVYPVNGNYTIAGLDVYEGKYVKEYYNVTGDIRQEFVVNSKNVDTNSIRVKVRDNTDVDSSVGEFVVSGGLYGVETTDNVFYVEPHFDEKYKITFGQDVFGTQPVVGNVVEIEYRVTVADEANGATGIQIIGQVDGYDASVTSSIASEGGSERETLESIKFFAPKAAQIQDRAINQRDYEILLKNRFSEITAVSVYGGEELEPPKYGRVVVSADVKSTSALTATATARYLEYLNEISPLSIEPIFVNPEYMYIGIDTTVYYNTKTTELSATDIKNQILDEIANFSVNELSDFNKTFRYSHLTRIIDAANVNIVSNDTDTTAIISVMPTLDTSFTKELNFKNALVIDHPLTEGEDISTHVPAIRTSTFTYQGQRAYIQDNGLGILQIIQSGVSNFIYLNKNVGTVNYATGKININGLIVSDYAGIELKIFARTQKKDIVSPKDRVVKIRPQDVTIRVIGTRV